jgi:hypothetical protein
MANRRFNPRDGKQIFLNWAPLVSYGDVFLIWPRRGHGRLSDKVRTASLFYSDHQLAYCSINLLGCVSRLGRGFLRERTANCFACGFINEFKLTLDPGNLFIQFG